MRMKNANEGKQQRSTKWEKMGLVYACDFHGTGYAQDAFIDVVSDDVWRIYYTARTKDVCSLPYALDVEAGSPQKIIRICDKPLLTLGRSGTFDETGITLTSIVQVGGEKYLYYCGWNRRSTVPYALSIGVAVSSDGGATFKKMHEGPIVDRCRHHPIAVSAPCVILEEGIFKMWYITFTEWIVYEGKMEPTFVIAYATSNNGVDWDVAPRICIYSTYKGESFARPWVIRDEGIYKMWYASRGPRGYRNRDGQHYVLEYAESPDGVTWDRRPADCGLATSESGWDSDMLEYASVLRHGGFYHMLYNGNGFGKTGFGYARRKCL